MIPADYFEFKTEPAREDATFEGWAENPATYTEGSETIILKAPVKFGYTFSGWYHDSSYKLQFSPRIHKSVCFASDAAFAAHLLFHG